jgi:hypothetical protein
MHIDMKPLSWKKGFYALMLAPCACMICYFVTHWKASAVAAYGAYIVALIATYAVVADPKTNVSERAKDFVCAAAFIFLIECLWGYVPWLFSIAFAVFWIIVSGAFAIAAILSSLDDRQTPEERLQAFLEIGIALFLAVGLPSMALSFFPDWQVAWNVCAAPAAFFLISVVVGMKKPEPISRQYAM